MVPSASHESQRQQYLTQLAFRLTRGNERQDSSTKLKPDPHYSPQHHTLHF